MNLAEARVILRIEFPNYLPIYLICKRIHWIYQYFLEITKYLRKNESFILSITNTRLPFVNLGTLWDIYSVNQVLTLSGQFTHSNGEEMKFQDLFLQSLKESEFLSQGTISRIQSLSVDQLNNLVTALDLKELTEILNFPIKIYIKDKIFLRKFSKEYWNDSVVKIIQEIWIGYDLMYFGVLLDLEFKFSDILKVLTPDNWFHLVLKESQIMTT